MEFKISPNFKKINEEIIRTSLDKYPEIGAQLSKDLLDFFREIDVEQEQLARAVFMNLARCSRVACIDSDVDSKKQAIQTVLSLFIGDTLNGNEELFFGTETEDAINGLKYICSLDVKVKLIIVNICLLFAHSDGKASEKSIKTIEEQLYR